ncbi:down syndrome cell adhesion molecule [Trichonephila clavipes]|nr:down syndrome cell adhesion molecule [Trichonephila clavipes]
MRHTLRSQHLYFIHKRLPGCNTLSDDKYTVLASGELILHRVDDSDGKRNFKCRARHKLTGELVLSPTIGKVIVTAPEEIQLELIDLEVTSQCEENV